jgi:hypothetical protein
MLEQDYKEKVLKTARLLAEKDPIEHTDIASYLGVSKQSVAGCLRWNYGSIGLEVEKIQLNQLQTPRYVYSMAGKIDESYLLKKTLKISEIRKTLGIKQPAKKEIGNYDSKHEPIKRNDNRVPSRILDLAVESQNRRKK